MFRKPLNQTLDETSKPIPFYGNPSRKRFELDYRFHLYVYQYTL